MKVVRGLEKLEGLPGPNAVSIGVFDGVHRGHQVILRELVRGARAIGGEAIVLTFNPHPAALQQKGSPPPVLTALRVKAELMETLGVDRVVVARFDDRLRRLAPRAFARQVLAGRLHAGLVVVGAGFRFGCRASGDVTELRRLGQREGFDVVEVPLLTWRGRPISSTRLRDLLRRGDIAEAARILGHHPMLTGRVVSGHRRGGAQLGFPTANLKTHEEASIPKAGVYAGIASVKKRRLGCVIDIGASPTFGPGEPTTVHVHIPGLGRDVAAELGTDLYGATMDVEILARIRDEKAFRRPQGLVAAIRKDIQAAREAWPADLFG